MNLLKLNILLLLFISCLTACSNDDDESPSTSCDQTTLISSDEYENAPSGFHTIDDVSIDGECMHITFGAGGCSGDTWEYKLIDSGAVAESFPVQRYLRLSLKNEEICSAYFTKTVSFDISALKEGEEKVLFNIQNYDSQVLFE